MKTGREGGETHVNKTKFTDFAAPSAPYEPTNRPFRQHTRLAAIFPKMAAASTQRWGQLQANEAVAHGRTTDNSLLGMILMACAAEQALFLACIYDDMHPDEDVRDAFVSLIKTGNFINVMDYRDELHRQRVMIAYSAVMQAKGKL